MNLCTDSHSMRAAALPALSRARRCCWLAIALGMAVRITLSAVSIGSNDAGTFLAFAEQIRRIGLLRIYAVNPLFNHPPLPALWAAAVSLVAGRHLWPFAVLFRLAPIAADALVIGLLYRLRRRGGLWLAAAFACNLDSILVSAFHCNTDPCYAALCLLAVYLIEEHGWHFRGGLALAAAINVKLIPVLLIPPLLLACRDRRQAGRFLLGLSLGIAPFLPALLTVPRQFLHNVIAYGSYLERWGPLFFLIGWQHPVNPAVEDRRSVLLYYHVGKYLILITIGAWSLLARRRARWNRYEWCAVTFALFLILTPGFGVQYTALLGPLLFAAAPGFGIAYGAVAGIFLLVSYCALWNGQIPVQALFTAPMTNATAYLGVATWMVLVGYFAYTLIRSGCRSNIAVGNHAIGIL